MKATFFNQPWLAKPVQAGARGSCWPASTRARNRFRVSTHARTEEVAAVGDAVAEYPATKVIKSTQIMAKVARATAGGRRRRRASLRRRCSSRVEAATRGPTPSRRPRDFGYREACRRGLAFEELLLGPYRSSLRLSRERPRRAVGRSPYATAQTLSR